MLKKVSAVTFVLILVTGLIMGCGNGEENGEENGNDDFGGNDEVQILQFVATIIEIDENSILVEPVEGEEMLQTGNRVMVSTRDISEDKVSEMEVGDEVRVFYTGDVMESDPVQLQEIDMIELMD